MEESSSKCNKKHPCPDCTFCQWCSDDRCRACRATGCSKKKLSISEQIELYERINQEKKTPGGDAIKPEKTP